MEHYISFNGKSSKDFGITISGSGTHIKPARRVERIDIPGRNGQLTVSDGTWENVIITYPCFAFNNFLAKMDWIGAWLLAPAGYCRLEDTYHPEHFRMAEYYGGIEPTASTLNRHGKFELSFNCKPMKYLKNGFQWMYAEEDTFVNLTGFPSKPIFKISGRNGAQVLTVNGTRVKVGAYAGSSTSVTYDEINLDCEAWEAYGTETTENMNHLVELLDERYPELKSGYNEVTCESLNTGSDTLSGVQIMPRWWML